MSVEKELEKKEEVRESATKDADVVGEKISEEVKNENKDENEEVSQQIAKEASVEEGLGSSGKKKKRKVRRQVQRGKAFIRSTYNNTIITLTDLHGNGLAWSSAGLLGFKGAKKATTYAANQVVLDVTEKVAKYGLNDLEIYVKGVGSGREAAIRALAQKGFNLTLIKDKTPIPHNGCRPRKPRRV